MQRESKDFFPLFFRLSGRKVLIVGGGEVAERKVKQLVKFGAKITLISPRITEKLSVLAADGEIIWQKRSYRSPEAQGYSLVIATTDSREVNRRIYDDAVEMNIPLNVVDEPELCTIYFPAVINRGDFTIAMGSDGRAPFLTRAVKEELEKLIPPRLAKKAALAGLFREFVMRESPAETVKSKLYRRFLDEVDSLLNEWSEENPPLETWERWLKEINE